jgi:hypothetical protein
VRRPLRRGLPPVAKSAPCLVWQSDGIATIAQQVAGVVVEALECFLGVGPALPAGIVGTNNRAPGSLNPTDRRIRMHSPPARFRPDPY